MLFQIIKQTNVDVISLLSSTTSFLLIIKKTDPQESLTQRNVYNVIDHAVNRYDFSSKTWKRDCIPTCKCVCVYHDACSLDY